VHDWSKNDSCVSWAAFYSDVEHEVLEVANGHRITLTYNLYDCDLDEGAKSPMLLPALDSKRSSL